MDTNFGKTILTRTCKQKGTDPKASARTFRVELDWVGLTINDICQLAARHVWITVQRLLRDDWDGIGKNTTQKHKVSDLLSGKTAVVITFKSRLAECTTLEEVEALCNEEDMPEAATEAIMGAHALAQEAA
jgi:hypothetical protein